MEDRHELIDYLFEVVGERAVGSPAKARGPFRRSRDGR